MKAKKLLILPLCTLLLMAACANQANVRGTISSVEKEETSAEAESSEKVKDADAGRTSEAGETSSEVGQTTSESGEASSEADAPAVSFGHNANNVYENSFIGIGCKLDDEWTFLTDDEILKMNNFTKGLVGEEYEKYLENSNVLTDMVAHYSNGSDTINVQLEKLPLPYYTMTEEQYVETSKDMISGPLANMGMENITVENGTIEFIGKEYPCINISATYQGTPCYELMVIKKCPGYMSSVVIATWETNTTKDLLANFYALN